MGNCSLNPTPLVQVGEYEFNPNDVISEGQHGPLFQGSPRNNQMFEIAVKQISYDLKPETFGFIEEVLKKLMVPNHKNIARYIDYYYNRKDQKLYFIMEFCAHGSLQNIIQGPTKHNLTEDLRTSLGYCQQIVNGVLALHDAGIIHENLRAHNILIHYDTLKISDFGLTELERLSTEKKRKRYSIYKAPELMHNNPDITKKCDIWSMGVIMYQIVYKNRPLEVINGQYSIGALESGKCPLLDDLITKCIQMDPKMRISSSESREHPFMSINLGDRKTFTNERLSTESPFKR